MIYYLVQKRTPEPTFVGTGVLGNLFSKYQTDC